MTDPIKEYYSLLEKWNARMSLMSVSKFDEFMSKHIDDANALLPYLEDARAVIDLGSGAGVPGIVLKIARPDLDIKLIEATRKKVSFLEEVIRQLDLKNIDAIWGRAEDESLARSVGRADVVVSRATWDLKTFLRVGQNYIAKGGEIIAMKGSRWAKELEGAEGKSKSSSALILERVQEYKLSGGEKRYLVVFRSAPLLIDPPCPNSYRS